MFIIKCFNLTAVEQSQQRSPTQPLHRHAQLLKESYISHMRVDHFRHHFQYCFHPYIFLSNISIALVDKHERIAKFRVSKCLLLKFLWRFEYCQKWIQDVFFLITFQFPLFLNSFKLSQSDDIFYAKWDHHSAWHFSEFLKSGHTSHRFKRGTPPLKGC